MTIISEILKSEEYSLQLVEVNAVKGWSLQSIFEYKKKTKERKFRHPLNILAGICLNEKYKQNVKKLKFSTGEIDSENLNLKKYESIRADDLKDAINKTQKSKVILCFQNASNEVLDSLEPNQKLVVIENFPLIPYLRSMGLRDQTLIKLRIGIKGYEMFDKRYAYATQRNPVTNFNLHKRKTIEKVLLEVFNYGNFFNRNKFALSKVSTNLDDPELTFSLLRKFIFSIFRYRFFGAKNIHRIFQKNQKWKIGFYKTDTLPLEVRMSNQIESPNSLFYADPFLYLYKNETFCFYESFDFKSGKGHIECLKIKGDSTEKLGTVLKEDFHLSFPFIFEWDGRLFMCPETHEVNQIRLYENINFPDEWEMRSVLIDNISAVDSILFEHSGYWWLMTNQDNTDLGDFSSELYLYYSDSPLSDNWMPHESNPIKVDSYGGRNGGVIIENGKILRIGQCQIFGHYGASFRIYEICKISPFEYEEIEVTNSSKLLPDKKYAHHFSFNGEYVAFDFR